MNTQGANEGARRAVIERGGMGYVVSDQDGEFARTTTIEDALTYAANLLYGTGTGTEGQRFESFRAR